MDIVQPKAAQYVMAALKYSASISTETLGHVPWASSESHRLTPFLFQILSSDYSAYVPQLSCDSFPWTGTGDAPLPASEPLSYNAYNYVHHGLQSPAAVEHLTSQL